MLHWLLNILKILIFLELHPRLGITPDWEYHQIGKSARLGIAQRTARLELGPDWTRTARLLSARLPPDGEVGQIARLLPPVCRQIAFDYPAEKIGTILAIVTITNRETSLKLDQH